MLFRSAEEHYAVMTKLRDELRYYKRVVRCQEKEKAEGEKDPTASLKNELKLEKNKNKDLAKLLEKAQKEARTSHEKVTALKEKVKELQQLVELKVVPSVPAEVAVLL